MRLTLRTLLLYLDDVGLEPAQAKEIGERIAESSVATNLVNRIREVMRRRRLTAPALTGAGAGLDLNTVAEYLDNTLSTEAVVDLERVCLESDVHLAEAAACHQILTLVMYEPVDVTAESRERMYALGPIQPDNPQSGKLEIDERSIPSVTKTTLPAESTAAAMDHEPTPLSRAEEMAAYLPAESKWSSKWPYAAIAAVVVLWFGLVWIDPPIETRTVSDPSAVRALASHPPEVGQAEMVGDEPLLVDVNDEMPAPGQTGAPGPDSEPSVGSPGSVPGEREPSPAVAVAPPIPAATSKAAPVGTNPGSTGPGTVATVVKPSAPGTLETASLEPPEEPLVAVDSANSKKMTKETPGAPEPSAEEPTSPDSTVPSTTTEPDATAVASAIKTSKKPTPAATLPVERPEATIHPAHYLSAEGVAAQFNGREKAWMLLARKTLLHAGDRVVVPEPFEARFSFEQGRALLTAPGGTSLVRLGETDAAASGWALHRGRLVFETLPADPSDMPTVVMGLQLRNRLWRLELLTPETQCAVVISPREPDDYEQEFGEVQFKGGLFVTRGQVRLSGAADEPVELAKDQWLSLSPGEKFGPLDIADPAGVQPMSLRPRWLENSATSTAAKQYFKPFEKLFTPQTPIDQAIAGVVEDRRPLMSRLAVDCLGLIEAIPSLVDTLQRSEHEEARRGAITALRMWVGQQPENREILHAELTRKFSPAEVDVAYRLLWGFTAEQLTDPEISRQLVDWLGSDSLAIRELSFVSIQRLTKKDFDFRPNGTAAVRQTSLNRWRQHLKQHGALLTKADLERMAK